MNGGCKNCECVFSKTGQKTDRRCEYNIPVPLSRDNLSGVKIPYWCPKKKGDTNG